MKVFLLASDVRDCNFEARTFATKAALDDAAWSLLDSLARGNRRGTADRNKPLADEWERVRGDDLDSLWLEDCELEGAPDIQGVIAFAEKQRSRMDDPHGNGSGEDSRPPAGFDWDDLYAEVMGLKEPGALSAAALDDFEAARFRRKAYGQDELDKIAVHHNWGAVDQDSDGNLVWNTSPNAETGWRPVTDEQISEALEGRATINLTDKRITLSVTERQHATILAALRFWQRNCLDVYRPETIADELPEGCVATNAGACTILTAAEVDQLCEGIN